jgi:hypothetical protein
MDIGIEAIIILIFIIISFYVYFKYDYYNKIEKLKSNVDNRVYEVQKKEDAQEAADLIAKIRGKLILLTGHLNKSYPDDERVILLNRNFNPDSLKEGISNPKYTSYSINKGEQIILCLRTNEKIVDINTMMFVILHEYSHILTESVGHTSEFWANFKWVLEESINIGIYIKQDFKKENVEYCGMTITDSPLTN